MKQPLILASRSPRRRELLEGLGVSVTVIPSDIEEGHRNGEAPRDYAVRLAREKALATAERRPDGWVLAADTIVVIDGEILGKPGDPAEARDMLKKLSGREHVVITAFSIVGRRRMVSFSDVVESAVLFRALDDDEIDWYVASDEPYDKAGGYAVQGKGSCFIREIRGSGTNVIGLPMAEVVTALKQLRIMTFSDSQGA